MVKCITCLSDGIQKEADIIWNGYSFCIEHAIKSAKEINKIYDKILGKKK